MTTPSSHSGELDTDAAARGLAAMEQALAENRRLRDEQEADGLRIREALEWRDKAEDEVERLRQVGDLMQSAGSRLAEWMRSPADPKLPYEVFNALLEMENGVRSWTEARRESR